MFAFVLRVFFLVQHVFCFFVFLFFFLNRVFFFLDDFRFLLVLFHLLIPHQEFFLRNRFAIGQQDLSHLPWGRACTSRRSDCLFEDADVGIDKGRGRGDVHSVHVFFEEPVVDHVQAVGIPGMPLTEEFFDGGFFLLVDGGKSHVRFQGFLVLVRQVFVDGVFFGKFLLYLGHLLMKVFGDFCFGIVVLVVVVVLVFFHKKRQQDNIKTPGRVFFVMIEEILMVILGGDFVHQDRHPEIDQNGVLDFFVEHHIVRLEVVMDDVGFREFFESLQQIELCF